jgi:4-hydroxybenzoate polyprenyltransferase
MIISLIKAMRPKQWAKNVFLFAGLIFDRKLGYLPILFKATYGAVLFSLLASAVYLINDLSDVEADKLHPTKKYRQIASGNLPVPIAWTAVIVILGMVFPLSYILSPLFTLFCLGYFVLNIVYSKWLKHVEILDFLILASFYVIRVAAGVVIIGVERFSPWLYLATIFIALFMGLGKRRSELISSNELGIQTRKVLAKYTVPYLDQLIGIVLTATILTYSLYTISAENLPDNNIMMLTIPFVIFGIFRYLFLVQVENRGEKIEEIIFSDRPFQVNIFIWGISILSIFYIY